MDTMHACSEAPSEEIPLLIEDFSSANSFEEHVDVIQQYLTALFDREPLLQTFLVAPAVAETGGEVPACERSGAYLTSEVEVPVSLPALPTTASSSPVSRLSDNEVPYPATESRVFGKTIHLYASSLNTSEDAETKPFSAAGATESAISLDRDLSIAVEVHVRDANHPITQQYYTPLFFLIKKITVSASYRETETNYLLSLLSTAVRQMLLQKNRVNSSVLRLCPASTKTSALGCVSPPHKRQATVRTLLPSPFFYQDGCAPCFAPAGDSYKQSFVGISPPLPTSAALPSMPAASPPPSSPAMSAIEWTLLHQRSFTTRFLADAFGRAPEHCQSLADYIDLFQLHVGQHSRIRSDSFDGICVSLWKEYVMPVPWKFYPYGPPVHGKPNSDGGLLLEGSSLTWESVLRRENEYTQLLCGTFTHDFGTTTPPLGYVRFHFQWNQLQDVEVHEASRGDSHLDPFQYAVAPETPGPTCPAVSALSSAAAFQAAQRKCSITVQTVVRDDKDIKHGVSEHLSEVLTQGYLEYLSNTASAAAAAAAAAAPLEDKPAHTGNQSDGEQSAVTHPAQKPGDDEGTESDVNGRSGDRCSEAQLRDLATRIVQWGDANVTLQESLIRRFATSLESEDDDDDVNAHECGDGSAWQSPGDTHTTRKGKRDEAVLARHLRNLWGEWETHQQCCYGEASAQQKQRRGGNGGGGGAAQEKDLRRSYFPDSFFARFAFVCATEVPHPADVRVLWRLCLDALHQLLLNAPQGQQKQSWQRLLDCLAMPREDPPVDLSKPLLTQKLQLLRYAQERLLCASEDADPPITVMPVMTETPVRRLITNGEVLCVPPPLPQPMTTADELLQRSIELNSLGAVAVESASVEWLQTDALYNDMCLFLYVNKAHEGCVVRFPDFVQWHSPRDFVNAAESLSGPLNDNDYLSERMQLQESERDTSDGKSSTHVWWSLWRRAIPRSHDDIIKSLFRPLEQAANVLDWLASMPTTRLLLEVSNASIANALHRLLCHRYILGDDGAPQPSGGGRSRDKTNRSPTPFPPTSEASAHTIPATPRIRALHRYVWDKCSALTKDVEAASALLLSHSGTLGVGVAAQESMVGSEDMLNETLRGLFSNALHHLGEIEVSVCTAVTLQYLLGLSTNPEAAAAIHALSSPAALSQQHLATNLQMRAVTVSMATWSTAFAKQFVRAETREVHESMVRLTCMAERPLNTGACFQQLVVHQDASRSLRLALALTKEVL
ncbi:hypothetical protein JKF63_04655 [Porcisia hertigi]|uniref:Rab3 GTPase-activating protein catalytic subunit n=1 Tax=Porcisia hertigi TaxID=2761500 RepID=A0A836I4P5_9TRYP|nr:hypothetical protein JKF63_04655 [Porcisia hertigi]